MPSPAPPSPPTPARRPHVREHHGDSFEDPYAWMADLEDPALLAHLEAENAYASDRTTHLEGLRGELFEEIRSRVKETDLSVPVASGPWWYFSRTVAGRQYASHVRVPLTDAAQRPDPEADAVAGEQVVVDGNLEAGDSEFFSLGALTVSADHRLSYTSWKLGTLTSGSTSSSATSARVRCSTGRSWGSAMASS